MNNVIASRKVVWPAVLILLGIYFLPNIARMIHGTASGMHSPTGQPAATQAAGEPTAAPAPDAKPSPVVPMSQEDQQVKTLLGFWAGQEWLENRGLCSLMFVVKEDPDKPNHYLGNTTGNCFTTAPITRGLPKPRNADGTLFYPYQTSAILSGTSDKGVLHFGVDKVIGERCQPTTFTFTPFAAQLVAEWTDSCGSGHIMLNRKQS